MTRRDPEHQAQKTLITWARMAAPGMPGLDMLHAIPNGGGRSKAEAGRLKAEGVLAGMPDLYLPVPRMGAPGLFIEMKSKGGRLSKPQKKQMQKLVDLGYSVAVAWSWTGAREAIIQYMNGVPECGYVREVGK